MSVATPIFSQQELAKHCARGAVTFRYNEQIMSIDTNGDTATSVTTGNDRLEADAIVVAMGSESPLVTRPLGIPLPVYPVKGYSVTIPIEGRNSAPSMGIADEERKIVVARLGDKLRAAARRSWWGTIAVSMCAVPVPSSNRCSNCSRTAETPNKSPSGPVYDR